MGGYGRSKGRGRGGRLLLWGFIGGVAAVAGWRLAVVGRTILADVRRHGGATVRGGEVVNGATTQAVVVTATTNVGETEKEQEPAGDGVKGGGPAGGGDEAGRGAETEPAVATTQVLVERAKRIEVLLAGAGAALDGGDLVGRRQKLNEALVLLGEDGRSAGVRADLAEMNMGVFLGADVLAGDEYAFMETVSAGDTYQRLARKHSIPTELLVTLNPGQSSRSLKPGNGIKVVFGPFHVRIVKGAGRADLYVRDMYVRSYGVGFEPGNFLPVGLYRVRRNGKSEGHVALEGVDSGTRETELTWLYGTGGRGGGGGGRQINGAQFGDMDVRQLYNALVEQDSYVRVDP